MKLQRSFTGARQQDIDGIEITYSGTGELTRLPEWFCGDTF
ncbi:hypothetical protein [Bradyrhizobium jicamae]|nr:hypothetical protein [Bradyrhizobium jicamae]